MLQTTISVHWWTSFNNRISNNDTAETQSNQIYTFPLFTHHRHFTDTPVCHSLCHLEVQWQNGECHLLFLYLALVLAYLWYFCFTQILQKFQCKPSYFTGKYFQPAKAALVFQFWILSIRERLSFEKFIFQCNPCGSCIVVSSFYYLKCFYSTKQSICFLHL